jgi:hypothetical protein
VLTAAVAQAPAGNASGPAGDFSTPVYVDTALPGGEPVVIADPPTGWLIYAAHAGETHTDAVGLAGVDSTSATAVSSRDQVFFWLSKDHGATWHRLTSAGGFAPSPANGAGFSDPDLTSDVSGRIYGTSINPGYNSLFSVDPRATSWTGTPTCAEGDRPFITGGRRGEAFLATSNDVAGEQIYVSQDAAATCNRTPIGAAGTLAGGQSWEGAGKPVYRSADDTLYLPWVAPLSGSTPQKYAIGVSRLAHASTVWSNPPAAVGAGRPVATTTMGQRWPTLTIDASGTLYLVWDTSPASDGSGTSCTAPAGAATAVRNSVGLAMSRDGGAHWTRPITIARTAGSLAWPWPVAGRAGHLFVAWYQFPTPTIPICAAATVPMSIRGAFVDVAHGRVTSHLVTVTDRPVHHGALCSGVGCIALGYDRRMGDLFDVALDPAGCVLVASGDTEHTDATTGVSEAWAHPLFIRQDRGPSLTTGRACR